MTEKIALALAQTHPVIGDFDANLKEILHSIHDAADKGADVIVFPEMALTGYPVQDLVLRSDFLIATENALEKLLSYLDENSPTVLIGYPGKREGKIYNIAGILQNGKIIHEVYKHHLPLFGVFDEPRLFTSGPVPGPVDIKGIRLGLGICEDVWHEDFTDTLQETGADIIVALNGSPYWRGKHDERIQNAVLRVTQTGLPYVYVNFVGGQDELVFDGQSFVLNSDRSLPVQMGAFSAALNITHWHKNAEGQWFCEPQKLAKARDTSYLDWQAIVLGLRDYVHHNGFEHVLLGLSGGIDSALTATLAVDALGADNVHAIMLPFEFTSQASLDDAEDLARRLGLRYDTIPIHAGVEGVETSLKPLFADHTKDLTEENIQARIRGTTLMAISNKFGGLLLTTGNKSEVAVGYATLYGDMCGGFNPIKDLYKGDVYAMARWRNENRPDGSLGPEGEIINSSILTKAPSAELRDNQKDQDSLPDYDILDQILREIIEKGTCLDDIVAQGFDRDMVQQISSMLFRNEFKRQQGAVGIKVSHMAFGLDWRYPITHKFKV